jgi:hypothetical protein
LHSSLAIAGALILRRRSYCQLTAALMHGEPFLGVVDRAATAALQAFQA